MAYHGFVWDEDAGEEGEYVPGDLANSQSAKDCKAYQQMMETVNANQDDYITASKLNDSNLMTSSGLASDVNSYVSGAQLQGMVADGTITDPTIQKVLDGTYSGSAGVVYFMANGDDTLTVATDLYDKG